VTELLGWNSPPSVSLNGVGVGSGVGAATAGDDDVVAAGGAVELGEQAVASSVRMAR